MNSEVHSEEKNDISIKDLILDFADWFRFLKSKWIIIVAAGIFGGAIGVGYSFLKRPVYTATTTFVLEEDKGNGGLGSIAGIASMAGVDLGSGGGGIFVGENILELYKSRKMIQHTLLTPIEIDGKKQLLVDRFITFNKLRDKWDDQKLTNISFSPNESPTRLQDSVLGLIVKDINKNYLNVVKPDKKLSLIRAEVSAKDEIFAKVFNDEIVKNVNEFYVLTRTKKSTENVAILKAKTDSVRDVMNGAIFSAAKVSDATPNLNPTRQIQRSAPIQKMQFSAETNKAMLSQLITNLELARISLRKEKPLIQVIDMPIYPLDKEALGKLKGLVFGGFIFGVLTVFFLILRRLYKRIINE